MNVTPLESWAQALLEGGMSNRAVRRMTGLHSLTVARIRRDLRVIGVPVKCACGKDGDHRGWCSHRYRMSFARQRFMEMWHKGKLAHRPRDPFYGINCRQQTYRKPEDARRSFYKFVCRHDFYGTAYIGQDAYGTFISRRAPKFTFGHVWRRGYPAWEASRSEVRDRWEQEFQARKEAITLALDEESERRQARADRVNLITKETTKFFRLMNVAGVIAQK